MNGYIESIVLAVNLLNHEAALDMRIPLEVSFRNTGHKVIRLLDMFKREDALFFFRLRVTRADGTLIPMRGGGKIDLDPSLIRYKDLEPGAKLTIVLDLVDFAEKIENVPPGQYAVELTYSNRYGTDCFRGTISSKTTEIVLPPRAHNGQH